jgi:ribosomal protein S18 acetylase RimI-like enzyme
LIATNVLIRQLEEYDRAWVKRFIETQWGSLRVVSRGRLHFPQTLPGFVVVQGGERVGLLTYRVESEECEIVTLNSVEEGRGIGSALISAAKETALSARCKRLWVITTNDNLKALRFYQKRGFHLAAIHANALEHSRRLKPEIPIFGRDGIPLRDEIELEMLLQ